MNRLPTVLRNEIWEYVHGDRGFWRRQFRHCMNDIGQPHNIRHTFGQYEEPKWRKGDGPEEMCPCCPPPQSKSPDAIKKTETFLQTLDIESHPLHPNDHSNELYVQFLPPHNKRLVRFVTEGEFVDGFLEVSRNGDLFDGIIFTDHVPDEVWLNVASNNTGPIRLKPVGNRLKLPWIPLVATHLTTILLHVNSKEPVQNFPCQLTKCHLDDPERDFIASTPINVTFRFGLERYTIYFENGSVFIVHHRFVATKTQVQSSQISPIETQVSPTETHKPWSIWNFFNL